MHAKAYSTYFQQQFAEFWIASKHNSGDPCKNLYCRPQQGFLEIHTHNFAETKQKFNCFASKSGPIYSCSWQSIRELPGSRNCRNYFWEDVWRGRSQVRSGRLWCGRGGQWRSSSDGRNMRKRCSLLIPDMTHQSLLPTEWELCIHILQIYYISRFTYCVM
jgi:hypothetical protein